MEFIKPKRLQKGDTVAVISPSWGGPSVFPHIYESGKKVLEEFGLKVKEFPTARADADETYNNPKMRADDVNAAFEDPEVKAIFTSIGGDDSVRILPYVNKESIKNNPKLLMGYSDTTTLTSLCSQLGLVAFNGPSIMAGLSQWESLPETFRQHVQQFLFDPPENQEYTPFSEYSNGYLDWSKEENIGKVKDPIKNNGQKWLQGSSTVQGHLFGGCIEVLEFMKGTEFWPSDDFWNGKILFFETSEDKPSPEQVKWMLRNYGMQGIYDKVSGILIGRARDYNDEENKELFDNIKKVVSQEFKKPNLPVVAEMDFGHTDPQYIMPLGIKAEIDCEKKVVRLIEKPLE